MLFKAMLFLCDVVKRVKGPHRQFPDIKVKPCIEMGKKLDSIVFITSGFIQAGIVNVSMSIVVVPRSDDRGVSIKNVSDRRGVESCITAIDRSMALMIFVA